MCDYGYVCEEKHLEDMELSEEFYEQIDELIAEESKKYIKKHINSCTEAVKRQHKKIDDLTTENNEKYTLIEELENKIKNLELQLSRKEKKGE